MDTYEIFGETKYNNKKRAEETYLLGQKSSKFQIFEFKKLKN